MITLMSRMMNFERQVGISAERPCAPAIPRQNGASALCGRSDAADWEISEAMGGGDDFIFPAFFSWQMPAFHVNQPDFFDPISRGQNHGIHRC